MSHWNGNAKLSPRPGKQPATFVVPDEVRECKKGELREVDSDFAPQDAKVMRPITLAREFLDVLENQGWECSYECPNDYCCMRERPDKSHYMLMEQCENGEVRLEIETEFHDTGVIVHKAVIIESKVGFYLYLMMNL